MLSECQSNQNLSTLNILEDLLSSQGVPVDYNTFKKEIEKEENEEFKEIAQKLNKQIRTLANNEYQKQASPITARVTKVYPDGCVDVQNPTDRDGDCWTHIPNNTIFQYLQVGDEVVLGYYNGQQKSNCWVMFAKLNNVDFRKKTIYKDIDNLNIVDKNITFLKNWMSILKKEGEV